MCEDSSRASLKLDNEVGQGDSMTQLIVFPSTLATSEAVLGAGDAMRMGGQ